MTIITNRVPEANKHCLYSVHVCITYAPEKYAFIDKYSVTRAEVREIVRKYRDRYAEIKVSAYHVDNTLRPCYVYKDYIVVTNYMRQALRDKDARNDAKTMAIKYHNAWTPYREQFLNDVMLFYADRTGNYAI